MEYHLWRPISHLLHLILVLDKFRIESGNLLVNGLRPRINLKVENRERDMNFCEITDYHKGARFNRDHTEQIQPMMALLILWADSLHTESLIEANSWPLNTIYHPFSSSQVNSSQLIIALAWQITCVTGWCQPFHWENNMVSTLWLSNGSNSCSKLHNADSSPEQKHLVLFKHLDCRLLLPKHYVK